jgi:S-adenosylmethionine decarboxylase
MNKRLPNEPITNIETESTVQDNTRKHFLLELYGCPEKIIDDVDHIRQCLTEAADRAGAVVLEVVSHSFEPHGVTAIALLAESHLSIHCWPESGYVAIDLFTCSPSGDSQSACEYLVTALQAESHELRVIERGK